MAAPEVELLVGVVYGFQQVVAVGLLVTVAVVIWGGLSGRRRGANGRGVPALVDGAGWTADRDRPAVLLAVANARLSEMGPLGALALSMLVCGLAETLRMGGVPPAQEFVPLAVGAAALVAISVRTTRTARVGRHRALG